MCEGNIHSFICAHLSFQDHEIEENGGELPETTKYEYNDIRKKVRFWHTLTCSYLTSLLLAFPMGH